MSNKSIWIRIYFTDGTITEKEFTSDNAIHEYLAENKFWSKWRLIRGPSD